MKKRLYLFFVFFVFIFACKHVLKNPYADKSVYTRVNMRYDAARNKGFYIAYEKLTLLPVNSKVQITKVKTNGFEMVIPSGESISFYYRKEWGGKPITEIMPLLFSESSISEELSQFSKLEIGGIKGGNALVGMSKKAVLVALGYPAAHETPSTESNTWVYWQNRFIRNTVNFENGKVISIK